MKPPLPPIPCPNTHLRVGYESRGEGVDRDPLLLVASGGLGTEQHVAQLAVLVGLIRIVGT